MGLQRMVGAGRRGKMTVLACGERWNKWELSLQRVASAKREGFEIYFFFSKYVLKLYRVRYAISGEIESTAYSKC